MNAADCREIFSTAALTGLFPPERANHFFEALFGDASEGAYDIELDFVEYQPERQELLFELHLKERPGKCLACNLTYGLPEVFSRHPIINLQGLAEEIASLTGTGRWCKQWRLGATRSVSRQLHVIPLTVSLSF